MKKSDINVLIVDDDATVGRTLSEVVTRSGYKAVVAARADEALNITRLKHVHVAVVDCMLPAMNGIALVAELRKTRFQNGAVILMSGIFRDRSFESEALNKTEGVAFLQKPFGPTDLMNALKPILDDLVEERQWSLQTILVRQMESVRDRVKLIEHLEQIRGVEIAFALSILMDAKLSGHLNLVTDKGGIYGLKIQTGRLIGVDSENADDVVINFLIDTGYLTKQDWEEFSAKESKKFSLQKLVAIGYISPHAALQAQRDQILFEIKRILKIDSVHVSFVQDRSAETTTDGLDLAELFEDVEETVDALLDLRFLEVFFRENMDSPIRSLESFSQNHPVWKMKAVSRAKADLATLKDKTLNDLIKGSADANEILRAVYLLVMFRQILFLDADKLKAFETEANRRELVYSAIKDKSPIEIFQYFGSSPKGTTAEIANIFKEFVRSNHPDKLSPEASAHLRTVTTSLFSSVSNAYDILNDPAKREQFEIKRQSEIAQKQMRAEGMAQEGAELIRRGSYGKAEEILKTAWELSPSADTFSLFVWSRLKQQGKVSRAELTKIQKQLDEYLIKDRVNFRVHMAIGLVRVASGDAQAAASFEKALSLNPNFVEARREVNAIQGPSKDNASTSASDFLTGDITSIVSQLFKKKKAK